MTNNEDDARPPITRKEAWLDCAVAKAGRIYGNGGRSAWCGEVPGESDATRYSERAGASVATSSRARAVRRATTSG